MVARSHAGCHRLILLAGAWAPGADKSKQQLRGGIHSVSVAPIPPVRVCLVACCLPPNQSMLRPHLILISRGQLSCPRAHSCENAAPARCNTVRSSR